MVLSNNSFGPEIARAINQLTRASGLINIGVIIQGQSNETNTAPVGQMAEYPQA